MARPTLKSPCSGHCWGCRRVSRSLLPVPVGQPVTCQWKEHSGRVGVNRMGRTVQDMQDLTDRADPGTRMSQEILLVESARKEVN